MRLFGTSGGWGITEEKRHNLIVFFFLGRDDGTVANGVSIASGDDSSMVLPALGKIIEMVEFEFLRSKYQKG